MKALFLLVLLLGLSPVSHAWSRGSHSSGSHSSYHSSSHSSSGSYHSSYRSYSPRTSSGRSYTSHSRSSYSDAPRTRNSRSSTYSTAERDSHGRIKRSTTAKDEFKRDHPCPATGRSSGSCPGYVIDHVQPLKRGGADAPSNMQWQTKEEAKAKDKWE